MAATVMATGEMPVTVRPQVDHQVPIVLLPEGPQLLHALQMVAHRLQTVLPHLHANPGDFLLLPNLPPWNHPVVHVAEAAVMAGEVVVLAAEEAEAAAVLAVVVAVVAEVVAEDDNLPLLKFQQTKTAVRNGFSNSR